MRENTLLRGRFAFFASTAISLITLIILLEFSRKIFANPFIANSLWIGASLLSTTVFAFWIIKPLLAHTNYSKKTLGLAFFLALLFLGMSGFEYSVYAPSTLEIQPGGSNHSAAQSGEHFLMKIQENNQERVLQNIKLPEGWDLESNHIHANANAASTLAISFSDPLHLTFKHSPMSGILNLKTGSKVRTFDFYSKHSRQSVVKIFPEKNVLQSRLKFICLLYFFFLLCLFLLTMPALPLMVPNQLAEQKGQKQHLPYRFLRYFLPLVLIWLFSLYIFYPGLLSPDSLTQWQQALVARIYDQHPFMHTLLIRFLSYFWESPAVVCWAQIIILATIAGAGLMLFESYGMARKKLFVLCLAFGLWPANFMLVVHLWKDIPYAAAILLVTLLLILLYVQPERINNHYIQAFIFLGTMGVLYFRHNGIITFPFFALVLCYSVKLFRRKAFVLICVCASLAGIIKFSLGTYYEVPPAPKGFMYSFPMHQIAAVVADPEGKLTTIQEQRIDAIVPLDYLDKRFCRYTHDCLIWPANEENYILHLSEHYQEILPLYAELFMTNTKVMLRDLTEMSNFIWSMPQPADGFQNIFHTEITTLFPNPYNLENTKGHLWHFFAPLLDALARKTQPLYIPLWRGGVFLFLLLLAMSRACCTVGLRKTVVFFPLMANILSLFISAPTQDFRYLYPLIVCLPFLLLFAFGQFQDLDRNQES